MGFVIPAYLAMALRITKPISLAFYTDFFYRN